MNSLFRALWVGAGLLFAATAFSQTTAPTAKTSAPVSAAAVAAPKASAATAAKATAASAAKTTAPAVVAAGGGNGKVWVNTKSKTYHCEGSKYYGTTKVGEYMTEADAKAKGNHADHGKACTK